MLTALNLSENQIGDEGMRQLSKSFELNSTLVSILDLSENEIGDEGLRQLKLNFIPFSALDLSYNPMGTKGIEYLSESLGLNSTTLSTLYLFGIQMNYTKLKLLLKGLCTNFTLTSLYLDNDQIEKKEMEDVMNIILRDNQNRKNRKELIQILLMGRLSFFSSLYTSYFRNELCEPWLLVEIGQYLYPVLSRQDRKSLGRF
jgi:Ran GTPase-activating protein (RanGAP) involved in mRNA processing and transport